jgi:hypothetical protein
MIELDAYVDLLPIAVSRSPVKAILESLQAGYTTLAHIFTAGKQAALFDLASIPA